MPQRTLNDDWLAEHSHDTRPHRMIRRHGRGPDGRRCGECKHLYGKQYTNRYYKCDLNGHHGPSTDWRVRWPACARFEEGTPEIFYL